MRKSFSTAALVIVVCMSSCGISSVHNTLLDVESYICERPDSALCVLDSMDRNELKTKGLKAHHALLHAMALDKNFIDVSDDSLAQVAVDYYKNHGDRKYYARALYYLGLAYYYQHDYEGAILELTKAEEIAAQHDLLYFGFAKTAQADAYNNTYNDVEEQSCLKSAYKVFAALGEEYYVQAAKFRLAQALYDASTPCEETLRLLEEVIDSVNPHELLYTNALASYAYATATAQNKDSQKAVNIYRKLMVEYNQRLSMKDLWAYAYSLDCIGESGEADSIIKGLLQEDSSIVSSYWQYRFAKRRGDAESALHYLEETSYQNEEEVETALTQALPLTQRDFHESQSELAEYKAKTRMWTMLCIIIGALLLLTVILSVVTRYVRKLQEEKTANLQYAEELIRQLKISQEEDGKSLRNKYMELYRSQFEMLKVLCDEYFQSYERADAQRKIYKKVAALIEEIREDSLKHDRFDHMIDDGFDGIMSNLRCEIPCLKELDYVIFSYFVIGFDATTISYLVDKSINTVYIRKSRIKDAIEELNPPHKDEFLEVLADSRLSEA